MWNVKAGPRVGQIGAFHAWSLPMGLDMAL
jgi:hypothetical protein